MSSCYIVLIFEKGECIFRLEEDSLQPKLVEDYKEALCIHSFQLGQKGIGAWFTSIHCVFIEPFQEFGGWLGGRRQRRDACATATLISK